MTWSWFPPPSYTHGHPSTCDATNVAATHVYEYDRENDTRWRVFESPHSRTEKRVPSDAVHRMLLWLWLLLLLLS
jgi:hypothetical protein